ncbi:Papilin, partial [Toxocara canis]
ASCSLPQDQGSVCHPGYKLVWFYDTAEGRCSQFWYGGCEGNDNRFATKEQCETICVEPPARGRCYLPKMEGPIRCTQLSARYWYDYTTRQCGAFWWRGCLGNANNFESWEECQTFCSGIGPIYAPTTTQALPPMPMQFEALTPAHRPQLQPQLQPDRHEPEPEQQYPPRQPYQPRQLFQNFLSFSPGYIVAGKVTSMGSLQGYGVKTWSRSLPLVTITKRQSCPLWK